MINHNNTIIDKLKFVDDSKVISKVNNEDDIEKLQNDLNQVYEWAQNNHMIINSRI